MRNKIPYLALGAMLFALCAFAEAQLAAKISRVGVLGDAPPSGLLAFGQRLRDLGWVEGQNNGQTVPSNSMCYTAQTE